MTTDGDLAAVFDEWAVWEKSRRIYAPSPNVQSIIGSLVGPRGHDRPDAPCDALMPYLHAAVIASEHGAIIVAFHIKHRQRITQKDGTVIYRRDPVKRLAQSLGISRAQFYRVLPIARKAIYSAATKMKDADGKGLMHWYATAEVD